MGGQTSKSTSTTPSIRDPNYKTKLSQYQAACRTDTDLQSFDSNLHARTNHIINALAGGVQVRTISFDSLKQVTACLLEMNQEVVKVILDCKQDIWKSGELFRLVEDYFQNSLYTLDFCTALDTCLERARDRQLLIHVALQGVEEKGYGKTLEELGNFKSAGDPFTDEFFNIFTSVYKQQKMMLEKLQVRKKKLDRKLRNIHGWRKVSTMIFAATFATVLICSVVAAAMAAPPVAAALAAATSIPLGSMGRWIDSLWKNYEDAVKEEMEVMRSMEVGTYVAIKDLDTIRVLIDRLEIQIQSLLNEPEVYNQEEGVRVAVEEMKMKMEMFMKNVEELGVQTEICSKDIRRARTVVLQRIIKPNNSNN